ncbi:hypothetical protein [Dermatophilus congolensis]|uniref:Uncharacterized protein n=1 Tax=Dermatophilus congolensis TaxID=1863 RepID=A0A239VQW0_9MICO|nr:hypothetical protein [Dermatophilus congolensis]MBO3129665.1 hypothetical protein [Dermatophilus congolensis]MBO3131703.1 hypothetical protein [Dermatophilus congolensis]MBO3134139.1 hypothetical protein [Dermatophilus congolensis]MBO3136372.1 hypothetical protein [Dermatophilus congolensis]MBO3138620.1 hypothetical protein [Dermatophilus congolensis]
MRNTIGRIAATALLAIATTTLAATSPATAADSSTRALSAITHTDNADGTGAIHHRTVTVTTHTKATKATKKHRTSRATKARRHISPRLKRQNVKIRAHKTVGAR